MRTYQPMLKMPLSKLDPHFGSDDNLSLMPAQAKLLKFIEAFIAANDYAPNYKEMMAQLGYKSRNSVSRHLDALVHKGFINRIPRKARALVVTRPIGALRERR